VKKELCVKLVIYKDYTLYPSFRISLRIGAYLTISHHGSLNTHIQKYGRSTVTQHQQNAWFRKISFKLLNMTLTVQIVLCQFLKVRQTCPQLSTGVNYKKQTYELLKAKISARKKLSTEHHANPSPCLPAPNQSVSQKPELPYLWFFSVPLNLVYYLDNVMIASFIILSTPAAIHSHSTHNRPSLTF